MYIKQEKKGSKKSSFLLILFHETILFYSYFM